MWRALSDCAHQSHDYGTLMFLPSASMSLSPCRLVEMVCVRVLVRACMCDEAHLALVLPAARGLRHQAERQHQLQSSLLK